MDPGDYFVTKDKGSGKQRLNIREREIAQFPLFKTLIINMSRLYTSVGHHRYKARDAKQFSPVEFIIPQTYYVIFN